MKPSVSASIWVRDVGPVLGGRLRPIALGSPDASLAELGEGRLPAMILGVHRVDGVPQGYLVLDRMEPGGADGFLEFGPALTLTHALLGARIATIQHRLLGLERIGFHGVITPVADFADADLAAYREAIEPLEAEGLVRVAYSTVDGVASDSLIQDALVAGLTASALTLLDAAHPADGAPRFAVLEPTSVGREMAIALERAGIEPVADVARDRPQILVADGPGALFDWTFQRPPAGLKGVICLGPVAPTRKTELLLQHAGTVCIPRSVTTAGASIAGELVSHDRDADSVLVRTARRQTQLVNMLIETARRRHCSVSAIVREMATDAVGTL